MDRTFTATFYVTHKITKANQIKRLYRNPIYLAREYKEIIDNGNVKNQAALARLKGISRARVTQILNLLNLNSLVIQELERLCDPLKSRIVTERMLRPYIGKSSKEQIELFNILKTLFKL